MKDCCNYDCNQGRDCPNRQRRKLPAWPAYVLAISAGLITGIALLFVAEVL